MTVRFGCLLLVFAAIFSGRANAAGAVLNLVFDGDSISKGAGATPGHGLDAGVVAALGDHVISHNIAAGGRPVSECLRLYPEGVALLHGPAGARNVIVFHGGDNDIRLGGDAAGAYAAFTNYVSLAHRDGWKVVVSTELRRFDFTPAKQRELEDYNRRIRANAAHADAVVDLDTDARLAAPSYRTDPALFIGDGVHPSDGGYAVLAQLLAPAVKRVAGR